MSTNYYPNIINQPNVYSKTLNPIYQEAQKRDTIYENIKVLKPIILPAKRNNSFLDNNQIVNYDNNAALVSEYPITNYNQINTEETINNNYFNQATTELSSENNFEDYFNGNYFKTTDVNTNTINNTNNNNQYYEKYFAQTSKQIIPSGIEFAEIKRITNDNNNTNNNNIINQNITKKANVNQINLVINEPKQKITQEKEIAKVRKITEDNLEKTPDKKIQPVTIPVVQNNQNNINTTEKKNVPMKYPGPAKISKMPNATIPLNPRVRVAREEKKINIVKLTEDNNNINTNNNININNKINNEEILHNNININNKIKNEEIINNNININNNNIEKEILTVEEKKDNPILNNINFNKIDKKEEIMNKTEINELNEPSENGPVDDYKFSSKTPNRKFHRVKILKKNPSNQLFPHTKLLDLENYNYMNTPKIYQKDKINAITFNNKLSKQQKKEGNPFVTVKRIIPKKKINYNDNDYNINDKYDIENKPNNNIYQMNNRKSDNSDSDRHLSDFEDNIGNFNDDEVKDTDEIIYNNNNVRDFGEKREMNEIREIKKEDSLVKKIKNNDGMDDFDNNFDGHDKFYKKMKNLFDD